MVHLSGKVLARPADGLSQRIATPTQARETLSMRLYALPPLPHAWRQHRNLQWESERVSETRWS